jgi:seryl-tRNA synthetase
MGLGNSREISRLTNEKDACNRELNTLKSNNKLITNSDNLTANIKELTTNRDKLKSEISELTKLNTNKDELKSEISKLLQDKKTLYSITSNLYSENSELESKKSELVADIEKLNDRLAILQSQYNDLISKMDNYIQSNTIDDENKLIVGSREGEKVAILLGSSPLFWYSNTKFDHLDDAKKAPFLYDKHIIQRVIDIQQNKTDKAAAVADLIEYIKSKYGIDFTDNGNYYMVNPNINAENIDALRITWIPKGKQFNINIIDDLVTHEDVDIEENNFSFIA